MQHCSSFKVSMDVLGGKAISLRNGQTWKYLSDRGHCNVCSIEGIVEPSSPMNKIDPDISMAT
jgi:hypothetical protein